MMAAAAFTGCSKDKTVDPPVNKNLVKDVYKFANYPEETHIYSYDALGRLIEDKADEYTDKFSYITATSLKVTETKNADNSLIRTYDCELNANGYITKLIYKDPADVVTYTYEYKYNAEGYMTSYKGYTPGGNEYERVITFDKGNPISEKQYSNGVQTRRAEWVVDHSRSNNAVTSIGGLWPSKTLFGKLQKNPLLEYKQYDMANTLVWHVQYTYKWDAQGYPVKSTTTNVLSGEQGVTDYTYQ